MFQRTRAAPSSAVASFKLRRNICEPRVDGTACFFQATEQLGCFQSTQPPQGLSKNTASVCVYCRMFKASVGAGQGDTRFWLSNCPLTPPFSGATAILWRACRQRRLPGPLQLVCLLFLSQAPCSTRSTGFLCPGESRDQGKTRGHRCSKMPPSFCRFPDKADKDTERPRASHQAPSSLIPSSVNPARLSNMATLIITHRLISLSRPELGST